MKAALYHLTLNFLALSAFCSVNLTTVVKDNTCPKVVLTCSAVDLPSVVLRWFFDDEVFAFYQYRSNHQYPRNIEPRLSLPVGEVDILILSAAPSDNLPNTVNFLSTMKVNFSALKVAGFSIITCGLFEEFRSSVKIKYQLSLVPQIPIGLLVEPIYASNSELFEIKMNWTEIISRDEYCYHEVNYTVLLDDSQGVIVERTEVNSDSCEDDICSISIFPPSSDQNYTISVSAYNIIGSSDPAVFNKTLHGSIASLLEYALTTDDCITNVHCFTVLPGISNCTIQYGQNFNYLDLGPPTTGRLNSSFSLPVFLKSSTLYYIRMIFVLDSVPVIIRSNYTTDKGPPRFSPLTVFLVLLGLIMYFVAITIAIAVIGFHFMKRWQVLALKTKLYALIPSSILAFILTVFWIVTLASTGAGNDTCDPVWQRLSIGLLALALILSTFACIAGIATAVVVIYRSCKKPKNLETSVGREGVIEMKKNVMYGVNRSKHGISVKQNTSYETSISVRYQHEMCSNYRSENNNEYSHVIVR